MKREPSILIQDNTIFLTMDLKGLNLYQRGKAIRRFINSDTKIVEDYADVLIRGILKKNDIIVKSLDKSALNGAFDTLKAKGKEIEIVDFYKNIDLEHCEVISVSNSQMSIMLEDNRYLICGAEVKEKDI